MESVAGLKHAGELFQSKSRRKTQGHYLESLGYLGYYDYLDKNSRSLPSLGEFIGNHQHVEAYERARKYLGFLNNHEDFLLFDVKYNNFRILDPIFFYSTESPVFLNVWMEKDQPIIHLIRDNVFSMYVSDKFMEVIGQSHYRENQEIDETDIPRVRIDPNAAAQYMMLVKESEILFSDYLSNYKNKVELNYENDLVDDQLQEAARDRIGKLLKLEAGLEGKKSGLKKTPLEYQKKITNKKEIINYFTGSRFEDQVTDFFASKVEVERITKGSPKRITKDSPKGGTKDSPKRQ